MDPNSGEIIAMASNEEYNLNSPRNLKGIYSEEELSGMTLEEEIEAMNQMWKNDIISSGFEPGSTFKPFTVAIGLEEAVISTNSTFLCDGGEYVGGWDISCSARYGHGELTLAESLMRSCNDAMMQIADLEGRNLFYQYQKYFSFGQKTGVDLPGEAGGLIIPLENLNASELATSSFGQSLTVTMLQMAAGYSSLVNGGYYYQPHVVKEIMNDQKATVKKIDPLLIRRTVSEETSAFIREAMYQTVELGTAKYAKVEGYAIGGKTGTAEKQPRNQGNYIVSFLGAAPAIDPEIVIYVVIDEPQNVPRQDDSSIATKFTSRILKELLPALGIYPEGEIDYLLPDTDDETGVDENNNGSNADASNEATDAEVDNQGTNEGHNGSTNPVANNEVANQTINNEATNNETHENTDTSTEGNVQNGQVNNEDDNLSINNDENREDGVGQQNEEDEVDQNAITNE